MDFLDWITAVGAAIAVLASLIFPINARENRH
jgi:hypothetical protein